MTLEIQILLKIFWGYCQEFFKEGVMDFIWTRGWVIGFGYWILEFGSGERWVRVFTIVSSKFDVLFYFGSKLNLLKHFFVDNAWAKFSVIRLAICFFLLVAFVFPWETERSDLLSVDIYFFSFDNFYKVPNYFWIVIGVYFWGGGSKEDLLVFLWWHVQVRVLCCLYLVKSSDVELALNFLSLSFV